MIFYERDGRIYFCAASAGAASHLACGETAEGDLSAAWEVGMGCACFLLLLSPADISHYVVVLTDQRQHVFSSQAEMEAFLSSLATTDVAGIGYPSALRWAQGAPALLCIVIGGACAVVAAWRSYRENCH